MTDSGSPSLVQPEYWWYRVRAQLLESALAHFVSPSALILDVGSADGPSVGWLDARGRRVGVDMDPRGLRRGDVRGAADCLPFGTATFDVVAAFDVIEHCASEATVLAEVRRVLKPGGTLLLSVPAFEWAWTDHDVWNGHHRRYTRARAVTALRAAGFDVLRASYMFAGTFPFFAIDRLRTRWRERRRPGMSAVAGGADSPPSLPPVSAPIDWFLSTISQADRRLLPHMDLPWGSSVVCAARRTGCGVVD